MSYDSDLSVAFDEWKQHKREKRRSNQKWSTDFLREKGIPFESKNGGVHLIVTGKQGLIDFWPSTGRYIARNTNHNGRGVHNMIKLCDTDGR